MSTRRRPGSSRPSRIDIGIDVGGTFTDLVHICRGRLGAHKVPSTPARPEEGIVAGVRDVLALFGASLTDVTDGKIELHLIHGSTVATNAFLERKGARVAFVGTRGHEHLPFTRRQNRPRLYDLDPVAPEPVLALEDCHPVTQRTGPDGRAIVPLDRAEVARLASRLRRDGYESVAVCFLFAPLDPRDEQETARRLRKAGLPVSTSHQVMPRQGEFERASATILNAYLTPIVDRYLERLGTMMRPTSLHIMKSSGGSMSVSTARRTGIQTILSGPAGGALGASLGRGRRRLLTFDMGGTSTDVALIEGRPRATPDYRIEGWPVGIPVLDILTIGAGGGSIARFDRGGSLRVGPESAGADPGPACYGRGDRPTVTDAHVALGHIHPARFLGGRMAIDPARSIEALARLADSAGEAISWDRIGSGILTVVRSGMERALRTVSVARGKDPSAFTLVSFGGSGGLHVFALARALEIREIIIPRHPGALSALGMLAAPETVEGEVPLARRGWRVTASRIARARDRLIDEHTRRLGAGLRIDHEVEVSLRYRGRQEHLDVPLAGEDLDRAIRRFHRRHRALFGYAMASDGVEAVALKVRSRAPRRRWPGIGNAGPGSAPARTPPAAPSPPETTRAQIDGRWLEVPVHERDELAPGTRLKGPCLIVESTATTLVPPGGMILAAAGGDLAGSFDAVEEAPGDA